MKVTHKLMLVFGFMALALIFVLFKNIYEAWQVKQQYDHFNEVLFLSHEASHLIHELQRERGLTSAYLAYPNQENFQALQAQRSQTDIASTQFYRIYDVFDSSKMSDGWQNLLYLFNRAIQHIYLSREDIDFLGLSFKESFFLYSDAIAHILRLTEEFSLSKAAVNQTRQVLAYHALLMTKEYAAQERGLASGVLFMSSGLTFDSYFRLTDIIQKQMASCTALMRLLDLSYHKDLQHIQNHPLSKTLQEIRKEVREKLISSHPISVSQESWFHITSGRINLLQAFEEKLFTDMMHTGQMQAEAAYQQLLWNLLFSLLVMIAMVYFAVFIIRKRLVHPLNSITDQVVSIIGRAQYEQRIKGQFCGEFALVQDNINLALSALERSVTLLAQDKIIAERMSAAKSTFVHNITHELRTPLNAILGFTQLLQMEQTQPIKGDPLDQIAVAARHLLTIINQVLDMGKIESGKLEIEQIPYSLREVVALAVSMTQENASSKGLALGAWVEDTLPDQVIGDPTRMRQVLINLLGNAVKFTGKGSVKLLVNAHDDQHIRVEVVDTGIGMTDAAQKRLFQAFSQADESITRQFGGTGLGLSLSKQLVELMGGEIDFSSQVGVGTRFWFILPLIVAQDTHDHNVASAIVPPSSLIPQYVDVLAERRVLLVEDNRVNQLVAVKLLAKLGIQPSVAENGEEALSMLAKEAFDLVLLDIQMPVKDGYETIAEIRQAEFGSDRHLCVIGLSANGLKEDHERALIAGMDDYITKPIEFVLLRDKLLHWLSRYPA